ncbi:hypothetical protein [Leptolyngbya sp. BC1307]|uniref:hypothetical protein n=1 Tax=Leptolyngbya sp. BC1307 TaxID=2029589 RepID=UPI000EFC3D44|nr:hypothetical protein [Leptolyngbya sp. BC1307]
MLQTEVRQKLHQQIDQLPADLLELVAEFLEFVRFKRARATNSTQRPDMKGLWADFDFDIGEEDIAAARKELWNNFPKDIA